MGQCILNHAAKVTLRWSVFVFCFFARVCLGFLYLNDYQDRMVNVFWRWKG